MKKAKTSGLINYVRVRKVRALWFKTKDRRYLKRLLKLTNINVKKKFRNVS